MKLRESGMPEEEYWETLFDVDLILDRLGLTNIRGDIFELGCGYGTFTIPVARRMSGTLRTCDIEPEMVERTRRRAEIEGIGNIRCEGWDVFESGFGVPSGSQAGCLLFNILHCEEPVRLLKEAGRVINSQGAVYVIHWRFDPTTPRGPSMEIRPRPEPIREWAETAGLVATSNGIIDLPPYHYGFVFTKPLSE